MQAAGPIGAERKHARRPHGCAIAAALRPRANLTCGGPPGHPFRKWIFRANQWLGDGLACIWRSVPACVCGTHPLSDGTPHRVACPSCVCRVSASAVNRKLASFPSLFAGPSRTSEPAHWNHALLVSFESRTSLGSALHDEANTGDLLILTSASVAIGVTANVGIKGPPATTRILVQGTFAPRG